MRKEMNISPEAFEKFLTWLDPNREAAGMKYEEIRRRLIRILVCRGCTAGEELADETINRVIGKMPGLADSYIGDPAIYFYGVVRKVHHEWLKVSRVPHPLPPPAPDSPEQKEQEYGCLDSCMNQLTAENRELILEYYKEERHAKIVHRKELAEKLGIAVNALRIRAHRIRADLQECVENCLAGAIANETFRGIVH
ncbi:MAG: hypothetical protein AABO57_07290 [Acidobacteriota bacterium]